jgi:microcystin-dependent protein
MSGSETTTPFLDLIKPPVGADQDVWGDRWNTNADTLDASASGHDSRIAALEASVAALQKALLPEEAVGTVKFWLGQSASFPTNWVNCDGHQVSQTTYPDLFAVLGYAFGGSGDLFGIPDMRGNIPVGLDQGTNRLQGVYGTDLMGRMGGTALQIMTAAQMPPHAHGGSTDAQGSHGHQFSALQTADGASSGGWAPGYVQQTNGNTSAAGIHGHNVTTDQQGGGQGHPNCQPGVLGYWIVKLALVGSGG